MIEAKWVGPQVFLGPCRFPLTLYGTNGLFNNSDAASPVQTTHVHTLTNLASGTAYSFYVSVYFGQLVNSSP
jgi:hypothetical protein